MRVRSSSGPYRYLFNIKAGGPGQGLRPFPDPDAVEDDADDEG
ncbi:hypothetical protein ACIPSA_35150 [Streptomyces sp. NPDC086549]